MKVIRRMFLIILALQVLFLSPSMACIQKNPFVFGASISAGYFNIWDVVTRNGSHKTPIEYLILKTGRDFTFDNENTVVQGGWYFQDTHRIFSDAAIIENIKNSSAIVSMDAFYWDAIDGEALYVENNTCTQSLETLQMVVDFATTHQTPLILANIPGEKGTPVWDYVRFISNWREPFDNCYLAFNTKLKELCLPEQNCFIVDIDRVVSHLNDRTGVSWKGNTYYREDLRSKYDELHLTELGNEYIGFLIEEAIQAGRPELLVCE